jgi:hypothetical protein
MSLKTFLTKIWEQIKNLFSSLPSEVKTAIQIGVLITDNIKAFIDSPVADILTAIIPGNLDDKLKDELRVKLPIILTELKLADKCASLSDQDEITKCALQTLQGITGDAASAFLHSLSILIAQVVSDGKLTWSDGAYILEWYYQHEYQQ